MEIKSTLALFIANLPCRLSLPQRSDFRRNVCGLKQLFSRRFCKGANYFGGSEILPGAGSNVQPSCLSACSKGKGRGPFAVTSPACSCGTFYGRTSGSPICSQLPSGRRQSAGPTDSRFYVKTMIFTALRSGSAASQPITHSPRAFRACRENGRKLQPGRERSWAKWGRQIQSGLGENLVLKS